VREERLEREIEERQRRLQHDIYASQEWAITTCRQCTRKFLIRRHRTDRGSYWQGNCIYCEDEQILEEEDAVSLEAIKKQRIEAIQSGVRQLANLYSCDPVRANEWASGTWNSLYCHHWTDGHSQVLLHLESDGTETRWTGSCDVCNTKYDLPAGTRRARLAGRSESTG
jgi:hypothetical protein